MLGIEMAPISAIDPTPGTERSPSRRRWFRSRRLPRVVQVVAPDGAVVCGRCDVADRALPRMRGLLGRAGLAPEEGMLISPAPSVHTFFMRFPIDVVFLDRERRVVGISHSVGPWRMAGARGAVAALELAAGTAARHQLQKGDLLRLDAADAAAPSSGP